MIEASARSTYPAACTRYYTQNMLEQGTKLKGAAAVSACETQISEEPSPSEVVGVSKVEVDGEEGSAEVSYGAGSFGESTVSYDLAYRDNAWKLDEMTAFPVFDRGAVLLESGRAMYRRARTPAELDAAACALERLEELDDASLQDLLLNPSPQPLLEIGKACEPRSASV